MTTGSSSPRSPEYAISAVDLPTGETTMATGTHSLRPADAPADADPAATHASPARSPVSYAPVPPDLLPHTPVSYGPRSQDPVFRDPASRGAATEPAPHEPAPRDGVSLPRDPSAEELFPLDPADHEGLEQEFGDPVGDLVRAAVADRPLEEVVDLITMLEQSPRYAQATIDALRAVGVNRSVEDVTRLVGLLTRPPRDPDCADEAIRAAAECRSVEDVTRLMEMLHRTPLEPHCGQEAVRAAATGRPVEELVQLIGQLAEDGRVRPERPEARHLRAALDGVGQDDGPEPPARTAGPAGAFTAGRRGRERRKGPRPARRGRDREERRAPREDDREREGAPHEGARERGHGPHEGGRERERAPRERDRERDRAARRSARGPAWPAWLTVAVLAGCGVAYFPLHRNDASVRAYAVALGLSALCLVLALLLTVRPAVPLLAAAVVAPAALAVAKLYGGATPSARVANVVDLTVAPAWIAVPVAVLASLVALTALCARVASQAPARVRSAPRVAGASRAAD
ncbi:hypothetical protein SAM40697_6176 [Streptomyces ambofaciens]|uniref:Integral membrane protein n=1 Tax=Streptomyces ambofaciens TaxID=1889 RepID=A0ABN4PFH0_STRAM|nr:hypothetical protein [Streptomyces ambofaciens]ANB10129.1 hypothetical protein SAM40697_6176 [Streptomyces ambofaciens]